MDNCTWLHISHYGGGSVYPCVGGGGGTVPVGCAGGGSTVPEPSKHAFYAQIIPSVFFLVNIEGCTE